MTPLVNTFRRNIGHELQVLGVTAEMVRRRYFGTIPIERFQNLMNGVPTHLAPEEIEQLASLSGMSYEEIRMMFQRSSRRKGPVARVKSAAETDDVSGAWMGSARARRTSFVDSPEDEMIRVEEINKRIEKILGKLPAEMGSFFLDLLDGKTDEEVAAVQHLSLGEAMALRKVTTNTVLDVLNGVH